MRFYIVVLLFITSCESFNHNSETCSLQGFVEQDGISLESDAELLVSNVIYTTGETAMIINGEINISSELRTFTIVLDPENTSRVIDFTFPLSHLDSLPYRCMFTTLDNGLCEITWCRGERRLYLRKKITL